MVEKVLTEISLDGKSVYGFKEVKGAVNSGAVEMLIVSDKFIQIKRQENKFTELDKLMRTVENLKGKVHIITSEHEGGKKLDGLGGVAALLRYKLNY